MTSTLEHYERHLAPVYSWMAGGIESAITRGQDELTEISVLNRGAKFAVDLGAGFGMHSIPLARTGCRVLAVDTSAMLLDELNAHAHALPVTTVQDDLLDFPRHLAGRPDIVLCMGDTLTHLPEPSSVTTLIATVARHLSPGNHFVISFRDYAKALEGPNRFIPVRSDESRILTCFLEYDEAAVQVHDILHEFHEGVWGMRVSAYRKVRLAPGWVKDQLEKCGFVVAVGVGISGMTRMCATRA
jgi:SAM-dependent methyltransferase